MRIRSLTERVLLLATLWSIVALITIAVVISTLYRQGAERAFNHLLHAQLFNVINSISIGDDGNLTGTPELGDLKFSQPATGWYWLVEPVGSFSSVRLTSTSLGVNSLPVPSPADVPFDESYERFYELTDYAGNRLRVDETEVVLDNSDKAARFRVTGNLSELEAEIAAFDRRLYLALAVFGIVGLVLNALGILFGLRPLKDAKQALERIRAGSTDTLEGEFPREILPLVNEVNALIDSNRRIVDRARMQVGNLAHSLKTPIAVLVNEARSLPPEQGRLVQSQTDAMQAQVTSYLNRARIAAQQGSVLARCDVTPVLERMVRVMRKLNPTITFTLDIKPDNLMLALEAQDLEETVGNLMENAARFAKSHVVVTAKPAGQGEVSVDGARRSIIMVCVEDDGPGLEADEVDEAMKRGRRLDETRPGSGLGLSIVKEISLEYQGSFALDRSPMGGLRAKLLLPGVTRETV